MRRRLPLVSLLLAAVLLAGPVLAAAHDDSDHGLQPGAAHCVVCVYAHGAGHGALPVVPAVALQPGTPVPDTDVVARPRPASLRHHPIRGPPALLG